MKRIVLGLLLVSTLHAISAEPAWKSNLPTTTPVTQDRDHAIYNWQQRHEQIVARHQTVKPDVLIIGDSIIHYWGGEPVAPKAWAPAAWSNAFSGFTVSNLGFGWDRTENVLWRIEHGELDGISPRWVIVKIGTNNTGLNSAEDIAAGIEAVCAAVHAKLPAARVLLFGILPRRDEKPPRPVITDRVDALLKERMNGVAWLTYVDLGDQFRLADGSVNKALFSDGVHVNARGYDLLAARIHAEIAAK